MKLCQWARGTSFLRRRVHRLPCTHSRWITFNADAPTNTDEGEKTSADSKPLDKNFVFRMYKELGKKSQDRQAQEASHKLEDTDINSATDYFRKHDRPSHRLFGIYYKMAHSEIATFKQRGFLAINHLMHPMLPEELPLLHETIDALFTKQMDFDYAAHMHNSEIILNLDIGHLRDENEGGRETKISEDVSIVLPPIYRPKTYAQ